MQGYIWTLYIRLCLHPSAILGLSPVAVHHQVTSWEAGSAIHLSSLEVFVIEMARHVKGPASRTSHQPEILMAALTQGLAHEPKPEQHHMFCLFAAVVFLFFCPRPAVSDGTICPVLPFQIHKSCDAIGEGLCSV